MPNGLEPIEIGEPKLLPNLKVKQAALQISPRVALKNEPSQRAVQIGQMTENPHV
jgi:hypothetical protein